MSSSWYLAAAVLVAATGASAWAGATVRRSAAELAAGRAAMASLRGEVGDLAAGVAALRRRAGDAGAGPVDG
jgi:hypothetical protein